MLVGVDNTLPDVPFITETESESGLATYIIFVVGLTPIPTGFLPTVISVVAAPRET